MNLKTLFTMLSPIALLGTELPEMLDFHNNPFLDTYFEKEGTWTKKLADCAFKMGAIAFNEGPEMGAFFLFLKDEYGIQTAIETGTHQGFTASFFAHWFDEVHTIEILDRFYQKAVKTFESFPNVHCHHGSSEQVLRQILPSLADRPIAFYLDAHWERYWPLLDELEAISRTHKDNCVIVIDDVQVPNRPDLHFDRYGSDICRLEYFEKGLRQVFTDFETHYLIPRVASSRAKFVAIPKHLRTH